MLLTISIFVVPVSAENGRMIPEEDPNFVEMSLEDFLDENPGYQGYEGPEKEAIMPMSSPDDMHYEWTPENGKYYLYRYQVIEGSLIITKMTNFWYQDPSNDKWYYLKPTTGEMAIGWCMVNGFWYYFNAGGIMQVDWYQVGSEWYYLRTAYIVGVYGGPEGGAMTGEAFLPATKGSTVRTQSFYFDYNCAMQDWTYPLPTSLVDGISSSNYTPFYVNSCFNESRIINSQLNIHNGLDLRARVPISIYSVTDGTIAYVGKGATTGNMVVIKTDTRIPSESNVYSYLLARYMHLTDNTTAVSTTDNVSEGQYIGKTGNTGNVDAHFHIDVNAHGITTGTVTGNVESSMGQNPAAFFPNVKWDSNGKNPQQISYCGYRE